MKWWMAAAAFGLATAAPVYASAGAGNNGVSAQPLVQLAQNQPSGQEQHGKSSGRGREGGHGAGTGQSGSGSHGGNQQGGQPGSPSGKTFGGPTSHGSRGGPGAPSSAGPTHGTPPLSGPVHGKPPLTGPVHGTPPLTGPEPRRQPTPLPERRSRPTPGFNPPATRQRYDWRSYQQGKRPPQWDAHRHEFNRGDWQRNYRAERRYHWRPYVRPHGWYYERWTFGMILPTLFWTQDYWIDDYWMFGLADPPYGYVWVRSGEDALLVNVQSGYILQVVYGVFY